MLDKERLARLELEVYGLVEETFKEFPAGTSMSILSQFINGFYLIRNLYEEFTKQMKGGNK